VEKPDLNVAPACGSGSGSDRLIGRWSTACRENADISGQWERCSAACGKDRYVTCLKSASL